MKKKLISILLVLALAAGMVSIFTQSAAASNETTVYDFLVNVMGLNTAAACGAMANLEHESGFDPASTFLEKGGYYSYGLCQWNRGRYDSLISWCNSNGYDYKSLTGQLYFMKHELETSELSAYNHFRYVENTLEGAYTAAYNWARYFERCAEIYQGRYQWVERAELAVNKYWPRYHTHTYSSSVTTQPGCISNGVRTYSCACGASYTESISPLGHSWGAWGITAAPGCTSQGVNTRYCSRCDQTDTLAIPAKGHSYSAKTVLPTCTKAGYDLHTCSGCGSQYTDNPVAPNGHTFVNGICTVCGATDETVRKGDINLDGVITSADAVLLARYLVSTAQLNDAQLAAADLSGDGKVTSADAVLLAQELVR